MLNVIYKGKCRCGCNMSAHKYYRLWSGRYEIIECKNCNCEQYNHFDNLEYVEYLNAKSL